MRDSKYCVLLLTAVKREKQKKTTKKHFKGKVFIFIVQSMIPYQFAVDLLTYLELY